MTPRDIAKGTSWEKVLVAYHYFYPKYGVKSAKKAYDTLRKARKSKSDGQKIIVTCIREEWESKELTRDEYYSTFSDKYSLSFQPWNRIANMEIEPATYDKTADADLLAHLIWEMSFYGDEKEMKKEGEELKRRVKVVDKYDRPRGAITADKGHGGK